MVIFHDYVRLPEGRSTIQPAKNGTWNVFWRVSKIDHDLRQGFSQQKMVVSKHLEWF